MRQAERCVVLPVWSLEQNVPEATMSYLQNRDREVVGRRKTIDRNSVVDAAEALVAERGSSALTISAVAEVAGITKGGVQSCFGTKEALIAAMLDRWMGDYERCFEAALGDERNPPQSNCRAPCRDL